MSRSVTLDPETLLHAYAQGVFPMADRDGSIHWYTADPRGVMPLDDTFHVPGTLKQLVRSAKFDVRINYDFPRTMQSCMTARLGETWINPDLISAYTRLHQLGYAHSVECWLDAKLVGGLYGVSLGAAFFGESMFHTERDASKVALVHLVERLRDRSFELLDTQATTPHLRTFGCTDIPAAEYAKRLERALPRECKFD